MALNQLTGRIAFTSPRDAAERCGPPGGGELDELALHRFIRETEGHLGRTINYSLLTATELARRKRARGGFLARILAGPAIPLMC